MNKPWCPFDQAVHSLHRYTYFFRQSDFEEISQEVEDFLDEHSTNDYAYAWVRTNDHGRILIVDFLVGVPTLLAMPVKLAFGIDGFTLGDDKYRIDKKYDDTYEIWQYLHTFIVKEEQE